MNKTISRFTTSPYEDCNSRHTIPLFISKNGENKVLVMKELFDKNDDELFNVEAIHDETYDFYVLNYHLSEIEDIESENELFFV